MTIQMNIAQAKARLSELVARAEAGEEVVIARDGKPAVSLTPRVHRDAAVTRKLGIWDHLGPGIREDLFLRPDREIEQTITLWETASINPAR